LLRTLLFKVVVEVLRKLKFMRLAEMGFVLRIEEKMYVIVVDVEKGVK
jgi:hypothetical protein